MLKQRFINSQYLNEISIVHGGLPVSRHARALRIAQNAHYAAIEKAIGC